MSKPWEEKWFPGDCLVHTKDGIVADTRMAFSDTITGVGTVGHPPVPADRAEVVAKFVAAAPDLARALLAVEWEGFAQDEAPVCPSCGTCRDREAHLPDGRVIPAGTHQEICAIDAALRKAGVR